MGSQLIFDKIKTKKIMLGTLSEEQIELLLKSQTICRLGCYLNGKIYVVPVTYAYSDGYLYAHSKVGLKIDMMRKNPDICIEIDTMENMSNWQSVIAWGKFEELITTEDQTKGMQILVNRMMPLMTSETAAPSHKLVSPHSTETKGHKPIVFRVNLVEKTGRFEKR